MGAPQYILLGIILLKLGIVIARHGEQRREKYNFFLHLINAGIMIWLLSWGGFFS